MRYILLFLLISGLYLNAQNEIKNSILIQFKDKKAEKEFSSQLSTNVHKEVIYERFNLYKFVYPEDLDELKLKQYSSNKGVLNIQFEHKITYRNIPNDSLFPMQWNLMNDGSQGIEDADIDADLAWQKNTGGINAAGDTMVIAVVDGGFEMAHEDINYYINKNEIPDNGVDDDLNGYVDDYHGWNAYDDNGDMSITDSHGTHVAGIAGAKGNNEVGISGVSWNSKILAVAGSSGSESVVLRAYGYIYNMRKLYDDTNGEEGAFVVATNSSFGVDQSFEGDFPLWCAFYDSLGSLGILNSVAVPNNNIDIDAVGDIPGTCSSDYILAVTNLGPTDHVVTAATGQQNVDLGAPGVNIYSTIPENFGGNFYNDATGTSMAAPHVAGAVAYILSVACDSVWSLYDTHPSDVIKMVKRYIMEGVDRLDDLEGRALSNGRLNLNGAYERMSWYCDNESFVSVNAIDLIEGLNLSPNPVSSFLTVDINLKSNTSYSWIIYSSMGQRVKSSERINFNSGKTQIGVSVHDLSPGLYYFSLSNQRVKPFIVK